MRYEIKILEKAEHELSKIPLLNRKRIAREGELSGHYRIRVGDYRVIYQIQTKVLIIVVVRIGHRKEIYR